MFFNTQIHYDNLKIIFIQTNSDENYSDEYFCPESF